MGDDFSLLVERVAERTRQLREAGKLSQEQLAGRAKLHPTYIGQFERRERKNPSLETLHKIATGLGVTVQELLGEEELAPKEDVLERERTRFFEDLDDEAIKVLEDLVRRIRSLR